MARFTFFFLNLEIVLVYFFYKRHVRLLLIVVIIQTLALCKFKQVGAKSHMVPFRLTFPTVKYDE